MTHQQLRDPMTFFFFMNDQCYIRALRAWEGLNWLGCCPVLDVYEHSNELKCHVKCGTYTDQLCNYRLLNNYFVAWSLSIVTKEPHFNTCTVHLWGQAVAQLVEALRYKPEGRGFDSRWCHWNFSLT